MAKSFGGAIASGVPVVMTGKDRVPEVMMQVGKEKEALEMLEKMGLIKIVIVPEKTMSQDILPPNVRKIW
jgi:acetyl-CoA acetyltransferase